MVKKWKLYQFAIFVAVCILLNNGGRMLAAHYEWPIWLDSFGTVFCAYLAGPVCGAIVGLTANLIYGMENHLSIVYGLTSITLGIIVGIGWVPLQKYLVLSVGIHIAHTGIVGRIAERTSVGCYAISRLLQFDGQIAIGGICTQLVAAVLAATTHLVSGATSQRSLIYIKCTTLAQGLRVQLLSVAIHIKGLTYSIAGKSAPANHHLLALTYGHHTTIQLFAVDMLHIVTRLSLHKAQR